jgi:NADH-quinone oxidoreductase subunit L
MTLPLIQAAAEAHAPTGAVSWVWLTVALPLARLPGQRVGWRSSAREPRPPSPRWGRGSCSRPFAVAAAIFLQLRSAPPEAPLIVELWRWIPSGGLDIRFAFQVDQLSTVMLLVVTGRRQPDPPVQASGTCAPIRDTRRYFAYLNLFVAFMLVLVLGSNLRCCSSGGKGWGSAPTC